MSTYTTDMGKVSQKLATKIADLEFQLAQMQVIAETMRDERDVAVSAMSASRPTPNFSVQTEFEQVVSPDTESTVDDESV